ncbi:hypothetical protein [Rhizobium sp. CF142]|uniref:hypothetical protein n=1 Tax=Rhizobium sp. CF142 TaxID=1144314 RepID=UPI00026F0244|nr:hypothetical protein [Rhizobium sp. CF142]EJJ29847.1 hypothetical protein PMI11_01910 [Rhizobium sp. CF142]
MSFDLYLNFKPGVRRQDILGFLATRANYKANGSQTMYENEVTGVYFMLNLREEKNGLLRRSEVKGHIEINYCRPSFFGLEAEIEIDALLKRFPCQIEDPQMNGMGDGPYSREGFLRSWNAGNEFGLGAIHSQSGAAIWCLPTSQLHRAWQWNYSRPVRQTECGEQQFVPRILFMNVAGKTRTIAVWGDFLPSILPEVDFVPAGGVAPNGGQEFTLIKWQQLAELLTAVGYESGPEGFNLDYVAAPKPIVDFVNDLPPTGISELVRLPPDQVLDEELVSRVLTARKNAPP